MSRIRLVVFALSLCLAAGAYALTPAITAVRPSVLPTSGGTIGVLTSGWSPLDCGSICNIDILVGGQAVPRSNVNGWGYEIMVEVPPRPAGYADIELRHPYGEPAIKKDAVLFAGEEDYETVLLTTIVARNTTIPGAFGSLWKTTTTVTNGSDAAFDIAVPWSRDLVSPPPPDIVHIQPQSIATFEVAETGPLVVRIPRAVADRVTFQTRVHDVSRAATNFGTRIASVRESDFQRTVIAIADIPTADPFRSTLRIYSPGGTPRSFHVSVAVQPKNMLKPQAFTEPLQPPYVLSHRIATTARQHEAPYSPAVAEILLPASGSEPVVAIIEPVDDGTAPFYAFVSVTNNDTQHVTVLTPR